MISSGFRRLPVVTDNFVCGIITATDIMRYLGNGEAFKKLVTGHMDEALSAPISDIMKNNIITTGPKQAERSFAHHAPKQDRLAARHQTASWRGSSPSETYSCCKGGEEMTEVAEIMSTPVFIVSAKDNMARARNLMLRNGISRSRSWTAEN